MTTGQRRILEAGALCALAVALYGPRLGHPFVTDDAIYIVENRAVTHGAPLAAYFTDRATVASNPDFQWQSYRPLRTLAFRAVAKVGGVNPLPFGVANLVLYLAGALLLLGLGRRLGLAEGALWGAALWVAAPVHVEPVLYASALGDHLSLVLELAGLWLAVDALAAPRPLGRATLGWLLVTAAMLTKEMAVTAPALLALLAWVTGANRRRAALLVAAYGAAAAGYLLVRTAVLGAFGHGAVTGGGALAQLAMVPWRLGAYLKLVVAPLGHGAAYVLPPPGAGWLVLAWLGLAVAVVLALRTPPLVRVGLAWFAVALLPVLGIVPVLADLADRFALLPSVGLAWTVPFAVAALVRRWRLGLLAPALLLVLFAAGTLVEGAAWRDELTLWSKAVTLEPRSAQAQRNLGLILLQQGRPEPALKHFDQARALGEQAGELDRRRAMALEALGRFPEAEAAAAAAITRDPELGPAYALYGGLMVRRGSWEEAEHALTRAQRWAPESPSTLLLEVELASKLGQTGRELEAETRLIERYPAEPRFRYRLGQTLLRIGDAEFAAREARICLELAPGNLQCRCLAGMAAAKLGQRVSADAEAACVAVGGGGR
jgi:tetratricopeptide (TPR) repeat protein